MRSGADKKMESFLRWWRGGSRGERRTINTTPLPQRYELYHRKRRNEGVSLIAACCIAFNLVMGSGFLALPAAVARWQQRRAPHHQHDAAAAAVRALPPQTAQRGRFTHSRVLHRL